jgi:hypothetical protein
MRIPPTTKDVDQASAGLGEREMKDDEPKLDRNTVLASTV